MSKKPNTSLRLPPASSGFVVRFVLLTSGLMVAWAVPLQAGGADQKQKPLPEFSEVEKVAKQHFASLPGRKDGDILVKRDVTPLFKKLEKLGWKVADRKQILERVLPDGDSLVKELRTPRGKKFMRRITRYPGGYDRLDRLRKMPYGQRRIREFIRGPDGYKLIEYITTARRGKNLGTQIARGKNGRNFNKPTGRLYTPKNVLTQLRKSHQVEQKQRTIQQQQKSSSPRLR